MMGWIWRGGGSSAGDFKAIRLTQIEDFVLSSGAEETKGNRYMP